MSTYLTHLPRLRQTFTVCGLTVIGLNAGSHAQHAAFEMTPVVRSGDILPGTTTPMWDFGPPIINDAGQVACFTTSGPMLYSNGIAQYVPLTVPGYPASYVADSLLLNNAGQLAVVFHASTWPDNPLNGKWLIFYDGNVTHNLMVTNDPTPSGDGILRNAADPSINDKGQVAFTATIHLDGTTQTRIGLFIATVDGIVEVARTLDPAPEGGGELINQIRSHCIDEHGRVTFVYRTTGSKDAIARGDGGPLELMLAPGQEAPRGGVVTTISGNPAYNRHGHVLFLTVVQEPEESFWSLLRVDDDGLHELVRRGDPTPDGSTIMHSCTPASLNAQGHAVFRAHIGSFAGGTGVYRYDGKTIHTIVQGGDWVPGYAFWNFFQLLHHIVPANDAQQGAVTWRQGWLGPEMGLWARDALDDLHPVVELGRYYEFAPGESYRAEAVTIRHGGNTLANGVKVLNNHRDICFRLQFETGHVGIYIARLDAADCNHNGIADAIEIAADPSLDQNGDGVLDSCQYACPADISGPNGWPDTHVDVSDLLALLAQWGPQCFGCTADLNGDGAVDVSDLMLLLQNWGPCDV